MPGINEYDKKKQVREIIALHLELISYCLEKEYLFKKEILNSCIETFIKTINKLNEEI